MELNEIMVLFEKHEAQEYARGFDVGKEYGYKKGYDAGCRDRDKIYTEDKEDYQRGLDDAWEYARKIANIDFDTLKVFKSCHFKNEVFANFTASEAIAKIKEYEEKQTEKSCENCKCFGDITECMKRPCYALSCWTPKKTTDKIKAEYDEETRSYAYVVEGEKE